MYNVLDNCWLWADNWRKAGKLLKDDLIFEYRISRVSNWKKSHLETCWVINKLYDCEREWICFLTLFLNAWLERVNLLISNFEQIFKRMILYLN